MACRTSVDADRDRCFVGIDDDAGGVEWHRVSSLGVVMGKREGDFGEIGKSVGSGVVFFSFCGEGMICAGRCGGAGDLVIFFPLG